MADTVKTLWERKQRLLGEMLALAREQLACAEDGGDGALERLSQGADKRLALMEQIDAVDREAASRDPAEREAALPLRDGMLETLRQIDACDKQAQTLLEALVQKNGADMRAAQQTQKGVNAYLGAQNQVSSLYIDEKK